MDEYVVEVAERTDGAVHTLPIALVPTPTQEYRTHRKLMEAVVQPGRPKLPAAGPGPLPTPAPIPIPLPSLLPGARVLIWKQDPSVSEIALRKVYLPAHVFAGPSDARLTNGVPGLAPVSPNAFGDLVATPGTDAFDAVQAFAVSRMTLTMYQRALAVGSSGAPVPWQWNSGSNADPLHIFPHGLANTQNAYYQRSSKSLRFGFFPRPGTTPPQMVYTCRSLDIVAHETGHAVLDGLQPGWLASSAPPQTGGLHESFGDLTAIFLALAQLDQCESVIVQTKANLHDKTFLSDLAEEFGLALGRPNGLRNADNDLKLSEAGTEVHAISQVFTGAIYDILADMFAYERTQAPRDPAAVLHDVAQYLCSLVIRALKAAPATAATYAHVANQMLTICNADGKPAQYRTYIRNRFTVREVVVSPTPLTAEITGTAALAPDVQDAPGAVQDRRTCCGTMKLSEYNGGDEALEAERQELMRALRTQGVTAAPAAR